MNCPNCGAYVEDNCNFCTECGSALVKEQTAVTIDNRALAQEKTQVDIRPVDKKSINVTRLVVIAGALFCLLCGVLGYMSFSTNPYQGKTTVEIERDLADLQKAEQANIAKIAMAANFINTNLNDQGAMERILADLKVYKKDVEKTHYQLRDLNKVREDYPKLAKRIELMNRLGELDIVCIDALINGVEKQLNHQDFKPAFQEGTNAAYERDKVIAELQKVD